MNIDGPMDYVKIFQGSAVSLVSKIIMAHHTNIVSGLADIGNGSGGEYPVESGVIGGQDKIQIAVEEAG